MTFYKNTTAVTKITSMKKRLRIIQGGTSAGKTIALLLILIHVAQSSKEKLTISIVSETMPHLRKGAMRDFLNIMEGHGYFKEDNWDRTNSIYTFETGSFIEFFSADSSDKVRGPRRDILFINECNNVGYETYRQLALRTNKIIYLDYNPVSEFWVHTELIPTHDHDFVILTYLDNEGLPDSIVQEIESNKGSKSFWQVYGLGLLGEAEGKIYKDWKIIDEVPHEARLISYGLDYGYTHDPTAIGRIYYLNGGYIIDEIAYQKGLLNKAIADILKAESPAPVYPDSAEPKSNAELRLYGLTVMDVNKGKGSVSQGIAFVQQQRISITKRSVNFIKDYRNYCWKTDADGKQLDEPDHTFSHAMDAVRYGLQIKSNVEVKPTYEQPAYESPSNA